MAVSLIFLILAVKLIFSMCLDHVLDMCDLWTFGSSFGTKIHLGADWIVN
jgi:hypothetical protein